MKLHKKITSWLVDYVYMTRGIATSVFHKEPPQHYKGYVVEGKVPVLVLPGLFEKWSHLKKLADQISLAGHPIYIVSGLGNNIHSIPESGKIVKEVIEKEKLDMVIFVAHSKGGLIGKYVMLHYNEDKKVVGMVSIATPYSGSAITKLFPVEPVNELHHDSQIIKDLLVHKGVNSDIVSISPEYDNHVWSENGCRLEGAHNITVSVHGHHKVLYEVEVIHQVQKSIEELSHRRSNRTL